MRHFTLLGIMAAAEVNRDPTRGEEGGGRGRGEGRGEKANPSSEERRRETQLKLFSKVEKKLRLAESVYKKKEERCSCCFFDAGSEKGVVGEMVSNSSLLSLSSFHSFSPPPSLAWLWHQINRPIFKTMRRGSKGGREGE